MEVHSSACLFKGCLLSPKHGDDDSLRACLLSVPSPCIYLVLNTHKRTWIHTRTCVQIRALHTALTHANKKKTHTQERVGAFTNISLSISFCTRFSSEENYFSAGCFFFVYCEQTKALSAANHCMSNSQTYCSHFKKKKDSVNHFLKFRLPF